MSNRHREPRKNGFWPLAILFAAFVLFLYGPVITIFVLSFQGPEGGLTFPMRGVSLHWYHKLWQGLGVVDIGAALRRSFALGAAVMVLTVLLSLSAGLAFRKKFRGADLLFYVTVASLIMPSIIVSLGIGLQFRLIDAAVKWLLESAGASDALEGYTTSLGMFTSGLGAHLTWTLPFGLLIMFAVFNRFNPAYEEAARDQGATPWQGFWHVVLPLIAPGLAACAILTFVFSWNEFAVALNLTMKQTATVPVAIAKFAQDFEIRYTQMAAAAGLSILPALVLLIIGQRYIVRGLTQGAVK